MHWGPEIVAGQRGQYRPDYDERDYSLEEEIEVCVQAMAETNPHWHLPFISYHLAQFKGEPAKRKQKERAKQCGMSSKTYYRRVENGELYVRDWIKSNY